MIVRHLISLQFHGSTLLSLKHTLILHTRNLEVNFFWLSRLNWLLTYTFGTDKSGFVTLKNIGMYLLAYLLHHNLHAVELLLDNSLPRLQGIKTKVFQKVLLQQAKYD